MAEAAGPSQVAGRAVWSYTEVDGDGQNREYYSTLTKEVAQAIARSFHNSSQRVWIGRTLRLRVGENAIGAELTGVEPPLANVINDNTHIFAQYRARPKEQSQDLSAFIAETIRYPAQTEFREVFDSLIGIDHIKRDVLRKLGVLLNPSYIETWAQGIYRDQPPRALLLGLRDRYPLIILEGEVGAGKTALARSVGFPLSEQIQRPVVLFVMNAQVRGGGHVGELSLNIARAFTEVEQTWRRERIPVMMLIDEADALAQARGGSQRHVEDDAGVNTLIQRIDRLRGKPIAVLFATNLVQSLDTALMRRATGVYTFGRPSAEQRAAVFQDILAGTGVTADQIRTLVSLTNAKPIAGFTNEPQRYTYSDLTQRIVVTATEEAIWNGARLSFELLAAACKATPPTPETQYAKARREAM